jgi:hypothetical protein
MQAGRLTLPSGFSASCSYELASEERGLLALPAALYLPLRETEDATLTMADGSERSIRVNFGPAIGSASFTFLT